jgi:hypothetical protein
LIFHKKEVDYTQILLNAGNKNFGTAFAGKIAKSSKDARKTS